MKGLGYLKNRSQVMAMEDDEYPDWLWTLLEEKDAGSNVDEYGMEKVDLNGEFYNIATRFYFMRNHRCSTTVCIMPRGKRDLLRIT